MATVPRCDGVPIPNYQFHSYKNVTQSADGLNQPDINSLIQIIINNYYNNFVTMVILNRIITTLFYLTDLDSLNNFPVLNLNYVNPLSIV